MQRSAGPGSAYRKPSRRNQDSPAAFLSHYASLIIWLKQAPRYPPSLAARPDHALCLDKNDNNGGGKMDRYFYEGLIGRLEVEAARSPAVFRTKVFLMGCAAYVALF